MQDFGNLILIGPDLDDVDIGFETAFKRVLQLKGIPINPLTEKIVRNIVSEYRRDIEEDRKHPINPPLFYRLCNSSPICWKKQANVFIQSIRQSSKYIFKIIKSVNI